MRLTLRDAPIGRKLMLAGLLTTAVTLIAVSLALILRGAVELRGRVIADLETYASMIGANAAPAILFDDPVAAGDTLAALAAKPSIAYAAIYLKDGRLFAEYRAASGAATPPAAAPQADGHELSTRGASLARRISFKGEHLGFIHLQADLSEMYRDLAGDAGVILLAALAAFGAGTLLVVRLQRIIVEPLQGLAGAMQGVSERENYGVRVAVRSGDEVGVLSEAFNSMLERVQSRDVELARHRDQLEAEVARRTAELERELGERRRAESALQQYTEQIDLLSQMAATLQTCVAPEEASAVVSPFMPRLFPRRAGAVFLLRSSKNVLESVAEWGAALEHPVFAPNDCWAVRRGQVHLADPSLTSPRCAHVNRDVKAQLCMPMLAQGEMIGILHLTTGDSVGSMSEQSLALRVAAEVAQALANLRYREALRRAAIRDPLTGLFNRRYLEEYLEMERARVLRKGSHLSLVMIDIDRFKQFNDTHGHDAGDEALRAVGGLFTQHIRDGDAACRYGGEEFIIAMWDCLPDTAVARAERLRQEARELKFQIGDKPLPGITLSLGVAAFPDHGTSVDDVIRAADRALYTAKFSGRDRVCLAKTV